MKDRLVISTSKLAVGIGVLISFLSVCVYAQSAGPEVNRFAADGISFDHPGGYSVTDESTTEAQHLVITRKGSSVQLTIIARRGWILYKELSAAIEHFREPTVKKVATTLGHGDNSSERVSFQTQVGSKKAEGVRLRSTGDRPQTGEVIWLRLNFRLVVLAFVRSDADESVASQLWQTVSSSLKVEGPVVAPAKADAEPTENANPESTVLNGTALSLPQPEYPPLARAAHASGTVTVQVLIDEQGKVASARAVSGHPLLQAISVAAARKAKFSPTLLEGEPVKVTGVIKYHFIPR